MNASASLVSVPLAGEGKDEIILDTLPGKFTITRTDEALTPYGGLAAWRGFLKHLGIIERKGLLRKAADVAGRHCAAVGSPRQLSAPARPATHR